MSATLHPFRVNIPATLCVTVMAVDAADALAKGEELQACVNKWEDAAALDDDDLRLNDSVADIVDANDGVEGSFHVDTGPVVVRSQLDLDTPAEEALAVGPDGKAYLPPVWGVIAGRCITLRGRAFVTLHKCVGTSPTDADALARRIPEVMNALGDLHHYEAGT